MLPAAAVVGTIEQYHLPALRAYAARRGWCLEWDPERLEFLLHRAHHVTGKPVHLRVEANDFPAIPPIWRFIPDDANGSGFPIVEKGPENRSSIFHSNNVICAPFNRLAYQRHGGPHSDWDTSNWMEIKSAGHVRAIMLADMLSVIDVHLRYTKGMN